jgi:hypothetical protein
MADSTVKMEDDSSNHKDPRGKHPAKSTQRTDSADELEHASDEGDTKSKAKQCKRPTNGTNLPDAVRPDSVLWKIHHLHQRSMEHKQWYRLEAPPNNLGFSHERQKNSPIPVK